MFMYRGSSTGHTKLELKTEHSILLRWGKEDRESSLYDLLRRGRMNRVGTNFRDGQTGRLIRFTRGFPSVVPVSFDFEFGFEPVSVIGEIKTHGLICRLEISSQLWL
ncbi:hypothetical protein WN51_12670 [Melipona quadrifasciata]|uniref:Uncharacterized protein n=1 Tax=Melipona quadrifasciata TaxID=166423 RepID=A0A0M9A2B0_9HYME|nr:hypothetical protein WN51_12670 [Melipona quadrifasciata]